MKLPKGRNHPFRLIHKNYLRFIQSTKSHLPSTVLLDILIPVLEKDLETLPFVIGAAKKNLMNPIGVIYIVGKKGIIESFCEREGCEFVDEDLVLPVKKSAIVFEGKEWSRAGWLFQQLIKLNADEIAENENVLILDADTCLSSKQSFVFEDGKFIINYSDEYHFPYGSFHKLLPDCERFNLSFVCHHMIFKKSILRKLKSEIMYAAGKNWVEAMLQIVDYKESSGFSEYELYGNYVFHKYPQFVSLEYWKNKTLNISKLNRQTLERYHGRYKSVSFHRYN